jgi:hypothetical protein
LRFALDTRRVRLLVEIPLEVHDGQSTHPASAATGSKTGTADSGGYDPNHARERLAPAQGQRPVTSDGDPPGFPSSRPDDPATYRLEHEPIPDGAPVDYRYQFELMRDRVEREEDRGKSLDGKIASVIAGIVASIGFSLRVNGTAVTYAAAMLYLVPLITLFRAFRTKPLREAPTAESILRYFVNFPVSTLREGCQAMMNAITDNRIINDRKANLFDLGVLFTIFTTIVVLAVQVALAAYKGDYFVVRSNPTALQRSAAAGLARAASAKPAQRSGYDRVLAKSRRNG